MPRFLDRETLLFLLFLAVLAATNGFHANGLPLYKEEPRRVTIAQEMRSTGEYLLPTVFMEPYYRKPPLHNWLTAAFAGSDGKLSNLEARAPVMASLVMLSLAVFLFVRARAPDANALMAGVMTAVNGLMLFEYGRTAQPDVMLALFCFLSFALFMAQPHSRAMLAASGLCMGLAIMTKGYGPLFFYPGLLAYALIWEEEKWLWCKRLAAHLGIALLPLCAWMAVVALQYDLAAMFATMAREVTQRAEGGVGKLLLHLVLFPLKMLGYIMPLPLLALVFRKHVRWVKTPAFQAAVCVIITSFMVFWALPRSLERYLLPAVPLAALLLGYWTPKDAQVPALVKNSIAGLVGLGSLAVGVVFLVWGEYGGLPYLLLPLTGAALLYLYKGRGLAANSVGVALVALLFIEHGYYHAKNYDSPQPGPVVAAAAAAMDDPAKPWVISREPDFFPIILGADFSRHAGRTGWYEDMAAKEGLLDAPYYLWTRQEQREGCERLHAMEFAKGPSPIYVYLCQ